MLHECNYGKRSSEVKSSVSHIAGDEHQARVSLQRQCRKVFAEVYVFVIINSCSNDVKWIKYQMWYYARNCSFEQIDQKTNDCRGIVNFIEIPKLLCKYLGNSVMFEEITFFIEVLFVTVAVVVRYMEDFGM